MTTSPDSYRDRLDDLTIQFALILETYSQNLTTAKAQGDATQSVPVAMAKGQLDSQFKDIFILESQVLGAIDSKNALIETLNTRIGSETGQLTETEVVIREKTGAGLAAGPLEKQTDRSLLGRYISLGYYLTAIALASNFLYHRV